MDDGTTERRVVGVEMDD